MQGLLKPWTELCSFRICAAPFQQANEFQIRPVLTSEPFPLLVKELHKYSSHLYPMEVRTADVVHCKSSLCLSPLPDCGRRSREREVQTLSRSGIPLKSSAEERASDFFMAFLIPRTTKRDLKLGRSASPLSVSTQRTDTVLAPSSCPYQGRAIKRSCHDTMGLLLVLLSTPPRTSSTKISSARQSSWVGRSSRECWRIRVFFTASEVVANDPQEGLHQHQKMSNWMLIHSSLARACRSRLQTYCHATARAPVPSVDDSSTTLQVLP